MAEENVTRTKINLQKRSTIEPIFKNSNKQSIRDNIILENQRDSWIKDRIQARKYEEGISRIYYTSNQRKITEPTHTFSKRRKEEEDQTIK